MTTKAGDDKREKEGAIASGRGKGGVSSRTTKEEGRALVMTAAAGTVAAVAGETILNSFNHGSDFRRNSIFRLRRYNGNFVNNGKLNRTGEDDSCMPISFTLIAFSNGAKLEKFLSGAFVSVILVLAFNIAPRWVWKGTKNMRLGR